MLQLCDARHGVKKRCYTWNRVILELINRCHTWHHFQCHFCRQKAKVPTYMPAINGSILVFEATNNWRVTSRSCESDYKRYWVRQCLTQDMALDYSICNQPDVYVTRWRQKAPKPDNVIAYTNLSFLSFNWNHFLYANIIFDAMSDDIQLINFIPVITCPTSENEASIDKGG